MGKLKMRVKELSLARGIENANQLSDQVGLFSKQAYDLWEGKTKLIAFDTIEVLCDFFGVSPNELLGYKLPRKKRKRLQ